MTHLNGLGAAIAPAMSCVRPGTSVPSAEAMRDRIPRLKSFQGATGGFLFGTSGDMRRRVSLLRVELGNFVPVPESIP